MGTPESNLRVPSVAGIARQRKSMEQCLQQVGEHRPIRFACRTFLANEVASYLLRKGNLGFNHESVHWQIQATE